MSTKPKKKTVKTKKIKRAPLKLSYTEEEKIELKNKYDDILIHLSNFLSEHSVYEAVPENVKILVFSSELSFYEMIKVFIFEDIYCGLIYNPNVNNYLGLITTRDLILLYKYIIDNFSGEKIENENFDEYLKSIFSGNKIDKEKNEDNNSDKNLINNINIFNHLKNINYLDYLIYVKNKELQNINIYSVSLDDNLYETLKKINIKNIHRLLVEDDIKKELREKLKIKEEKKESEQLSIKKKEALQNRKIVLNAEKTTTTNDSDEEKNIQKIDIKRILETNKEDIIVERSENTLTREDIENSKEIINKEEKVESIAKLENKNENKNQEIINNQNNEKIENINIIKTTQNTETEQPKKKKIIKKKKIKSQSIQENQENDLKNNSLQSPPPKKRVSNKLETDIKEICKDIITEIKEDETGKKIIKKKIKKKIVKKKKDLNLELPEEIGDKIELGENTHRKMNTNMTEFNNEEKINIAENKIVNTEENTNKTETKKKKIKKKIVKKKSKQITEKKEEINNDNIKDNNNNNENEVIKEKEEIKDKDLNKNKEINNNIEENKNENNLGEKKEDENENEIKLKERKESTNTVKSIENIHFEDKMKSYVGIVTNETIFEYLTFNYYSNDMKEFNLSLNELLILGENTFLKPLTNIKDAKEKTYNTFNYHLVGNYDIIPIFSENEIEGFIYPKDFLFYIYNCESDQNLNNKEFLEKLYEDIDDEKPYGKNRVVFLELNDSTKTYYVKELIESLNCSIEKKIVIFDPNDNNKLFLISLKTIFKAIVEFNLNK